MNARRLFPIPVLSAALLIAACTSSTGKSSSAPASTSTPTSSSSSAGPPTTPTALAQRVQAAIAQLRSAHESLAVTAAGQSFTGSGEEKLSGGRTTAMKLSENLPAGTGNVQVIIVNGKTYAKLPTVLNPTGKPYAAVTPHSSNPVIRKLASTLDSALASASAGNAAALVRAAKSVRLKGSTTVKGVPATHYSLIVQLAKLPAGMPGRKALSATGVTTMPVELYVDKQYRPVESADHVSAHGQTLSTKVTFGDFNMPVTITAPPADQVSS